MIRIISGSRKGRKIQAPSNLPVRPTTDFAKEGLFNVLVNKIDFETAFDSSSGCSCMREKAGKVTLVTGSIINLNTWVDHF